jgi:hypothetical protein
MLDAASAHRLASSVVRAINTTYPHANVHLAQSRDDVAPASISHPAFHGSYDWHSCVHMHWSLVRLLNMGLRGDEQTAAIETLDRSLTAENIAGELAYVARPSNALFERPYGWAWLLKLDAELTHCGHANAPAWRAALAPLATHFADALIRYLTNLNAPIRHGVHANTAFASVLALRWARIKKRDLLTDAIESQAVRWFENDVAHGVFWEPSGTDFLSPTLTEALLMSHVLSAAQFRAWFAQFLPIPLHETPLLSTVTPKERRDAQLVHWDGLNLSKAWCAKGLVRVLALGDDQAFALTAAARDWIDAAQSQAIEGDFVATHWLASFVLLAQTEFDGMM